ncbi:AraC family transcriptional regulator [Sphingobacterium sp. UT-1RO-CII-1]|uniref:helix-turn-helix transcriptional regulator n=1 Tax=Sphingobacterium sp. UT-1RO-CII-1 TaxID=2995225 RepID=UPI002279F8C6|nr:AraC family transcriptional regulator [Sphingobacterium sp. UT-1RO-CII-1]MCY4781639.1 AraC family transcriptional regulator [Sphingobacterium sp. UT-1RO-CII-1]
MKSEILEINKIIHDTTIQNKYNDVDTLIQETFTHYEKDISVCCNIFHSSGLHITESQICSNRELTNVWLTKEPHVRFFFYLTGSSCVKNGAGNESYTHRAGMLQRNFLDTEGAGGTMIIKPNVELHHIVIKMSLDFYINLLKSEHWIDNDVFHNYVLSGKPENRPNETLSIDIKTLQIIQDITNSEDIIEHRYHFFKLKLKELLFTIHQQTQYGKNTPELASSPSDSLDKIKSYLTLHIDNPPTSAELAKVFLMNEKKLKQSFKEKYGKTIYAFVVKLRMEKAKKLLMENYNVNELAVLLGYQSVSHFIKVFKNYYGCTPKDAQNKYQNITQSKAE